MGQANFIPVVATGTHGASAIGDLTLTTPVADAHNPGAMHTVLARFDDVSFAVDEMSPNAVIRSRHYEGTVYHYHLTLTSGDIVSCKRAHEHKYDVGTAVRVYFTAMHPLVYFVGERAVGHALARL